jgi:hypothetical protein
MACWMAATGLKESAPRPERIVWFANCRSNCLLDMRIRPAPPLVGEWVGVWGLPKTRAGQWSADVPKPMASWYATSGKPPLTPALSPKRGRGGKSEPCDCNAVDSGESIHRSGLYPLFGDMAALGPCR